MWMFGVDEKMNRFLLAMFVLTTLACGMTAPIPSSDGKLGSWQVLTPTPTPAPITSNLAESVFIVTADSLQIRPCPYKDDQTCPPYQYGFVAGDVVMGYCRYFEDGSVWLEFDGNKYAAVYFDEVWLMEGNCQ